MNGDDECRGSLYIKGGEYHEKGGALSGYCICGNHEHNNAPWCASFVNWCVKKVAASNTYSASSQSFKTHSDFVKINDPVFGAIVVFQNVKIMVQDNLRIFENGSKPLFIYEKQVYYPFPNFGEEI